MLIYYSFIFLYLFFGIPEYLDIFSSFLALEILAVAVKILDLVVESRKIKV